MYARADLEPEALQEKIAEASAYIAEYIQRETATRRAGAIMNVAGLALLPPIVLLILGSAVAWAISGFRQQA